MRGGFSARGDFHMFACHLHLYPPPFPPPRRASVRRVELGSPYLQSPSPRAHRSRRADAHLITFGSLGASSHPDATSTAAWWTRWISPAWSWTTRWGNSRPTFVSREKPRRWSVSSRLSGHLKIDVRTVARIWMSFNLDFQYLLLLLFFYVLNLLHFFAKWRKKQKLQCETRNCVLDLPSCSHHGCKINMSWRRLASLGWTATCHSCPRCTTRR